jgi:Flp pilus assembly protein TadD
MGVGRVLIAVACLLWVAGCETSSKLSDNLTARGPNSPDKPNEDVTGSIPDGDKRPPAVSPEILGVDPNDELSVAKKYFRQGSYALAEKHFRKAVELHPRDAEAWLGLAASYDRLRRFDLADRAYTQATRLVGPTPEILNNQGFSYMLRGDYRRARTVLLAAEAKDPANPYIKNNLELLEISAHKAKGVR